MVVVAVVPETTVGLPEGVEAPAGADRVGAEGGAGGEGEGEGGGGGDTVGGVEGGGGGGGGGGGAVVDAAGAATAELCCLLRWICLGFSLSAFIAESCKAERKASVYNFITKKNGREKEGGGVRRHEKTAIGRTGEKKNGQSILAERCHQFD